MSDDDLKQIRIAAYHKWIQAGQPRAADLKFWLDAEREYQAQGDCARLSDFDCADEAFDAIDEAAEESFPASDPKSWQMTTVGAHLFATG